MKPKRSHYDKPQPPHPPETDEEELAALEEHYLGCPECAKRAEESADYVDAIRAGMILGDFDLE